MQENDMTRMIKRLPIGNRLKEVLCSLVLDVGKIEVALQSWWDFSDQERKELDGRQSRYQDLIKDILAKKVILDKEGRLIHRNGSPVRYKVYSASHPMVH